jgi:hypothetical protein
VGLLTNVALSATLLTAIQDVPQPALPFSVARIRAALERAPAEPLLTENAPLFRTEIVEHVPDLLPPLNFYGGPVPPGGLYAYEQRQRLGSREIGQPLITVDVLPLAAALALSIHNGLYQHRVRAARDEVQRAIREFCASRGDESTAIAICRSVP